MTRYRAVASRLARVLGLEQPIQWLAGSLEAVTTNENVFHLTFDDGPHPEITQPILDVLDEYKAAATFFVLTDRAKRYPALVRETLARGHEIGLHTRTHPRLTTVSWSNLRDEVFAAKRELESIVERPVRWFRPPYGAQDLRTLVFVKTAGMRTVLWSVDSFDWQGLADPDPLGRSRKRLLGGGILLLHDTPVDELIGTDEERGFVPKHALVKRYLEELIARKLRPVSLEDLVLSGTMQVRVKLG